MRPEKERKMYYNLKGQVIPVFGLEPEDRFFYANFASEEKYYDAS